MGTVLAFMMPLGTSDEEGAGLASGMHTIEEQDREGIPARRFIIRTAVAAAVESDTEGGPENETNTIEGQDGEGLPARMFIIRAVAAAAVESNTEGGPEN